MVSPRLSGRARAAMASREEPGARRSHGEPGGAKFWNYIQVLGQRQAIHMAGVLQQRLEWPYGRRTTTTSRMSMWQVSLRVFLGKPRLVIPSHLGDLGA